ncbi:MSF1 protein [Anopheles darlingi]|uniref:MSF1 protein n=1 Tax=Anopheles darlingi TaxID=43151 RepID=W5JWL5_ANODA|nr:protein preli-like [Anopheles darlingi]ETN67645.1 MSF1 protein [Anopheles darlingi]
MAKYYENSTVFNYSWEQVTQGFWNRYPNPFSSHVLSEDTVSREIRNGKLHSKRLLTKTNRVPKWGERFFKAKSVNIVEESVVDPKERTLVTYTRNIGFNKIMSVVEQVVYKSLPDHPGKTIAIRSAWIDSSVYGFGTAIRAFGLDRFKKNCAKTVDGFNFVLHHMFPNHPAALAAAATSAKDHHGSKAQKLREAAKHASDQMKAKAEHLVQNLSVKG